jgi:hypothetical protein
MYYIEKFHNITYIAQKILEGTQREFQKTKFRLEFFYPSGKPA